VIAFDDVSIPLPVMRKPDIRSVVMEVVEEMLIEEGITDITFVCSIALHRFIRPDEFRHCCGKKLFDKYYPHRMKNYNAVDAEGSVHLGYTRHQEDVEACKEVVESDLMIYVNINYAPMDGGYKSYGTGLVSYNSLKHNHDYKTLTETQSLMDPKESALHRSINRIGKMMQEKVAIYHIETVIDDNLFPPLFKWIQVLKKEMNIAQKLLAYGSAYGLKLVPLWARKMIFWSIRAPFGLTQVVAGETVAVHEKTLEANYRDKVVEVDGQSDILILAPTALGPYTKDKVMNPLLVNTYALGYYFNMYVGGTPLLRKGGIIIVVNSMHNAWASPDHDCYRELFEEVIATEGRDGFEKYQEQFATNERLNDIYRQGKGPAGVHGFYMYTWAAHAMEWASKVILVGCRDPAGAEILGWERHASLLDAVAAARDQLGDSNASVTYLRCPPVTYCKVKSVNERGA